MHLLTERFQYTCWMQITKNRYRNILRHVEMGWFSRFEYRVRNWPFWSQYVFVVGWQWRDGGEALLQWPGIIFSSSNHEVRFPGCQSVGAVKKL